MDNDIRKAIADVIEVLSEKGTYKAAKYLGPKLVVRGSRRLYKKKLPSTKDDFEVVLTVGRPNIHHREYIKSCRKNDESFPLEGVEIQFPPKPRK